MLRLPQRKCGPDLGGGRDDVTDTLDPPLATFGGDEVKVEQRPRLLSDNAPNCGACDPGEWPKNYKIDQVHGARGSPQTQGKVERWHQTMKNRILQEDLEAGIAAFVKYYNQRRYHERLDSLTRLTSVSDVARPS